jgi:hypothetical protein
MLPEKYLSLSFCQCAMLGHRKSTSTQTAVSEFGDPLIQEHLTMNVITLLYSTNSNTRSLVTSYSLLGI